MTKNFDWDALCGNWDRAPMEVTGDPLHQSIASWRHAVSTDYRVRWQPLSTVQVTDDDAELANAMRTYYLAKITMQGLRRPLTNFQQSLYTMLESRQYENGHAGMLYRLPYFYAEDLAREELHMTVRVTDNNKAPLPQGPLRPLQTILRSRRRRDVMEYWFADSRHQPVVWEVDLANPLRSLVQNLWSRECLDLRAKFELIDRASNSLHGRWRYFMISSPELP